MLQPPEPHAMGVPACGLNPWYRKGVMLTGTVRWGTPASIDIKEQRHLLRCCPPDPETYFSHQVRYDDNSTLALAMNADRSCSVHSGSRVENSASFDLC